MITLRYIEGTCWNAGHYLVTGKPMPITNSYIEVGVEEFAVSVRASFNRLKRISKIVISIHYMINGIFQIREGG